MPDNEVLIYEKKFDGKVVVMTMNRPDAGNSLNRPLSNALSEGWERFQADKDARVAILTGAGEKFFCAGADLKETTQERTGQTVLVPVKRPGIVDPLPESLRLWKPTIAAINGYAVAAGWYMAQQCDIRIASAHAEMGIAEARWNMPAAWISMMTRQMHMGHALEIALWGDKRITAQRAYEIGWVNRVVPKEKLMAEALDWAERMLYMAPRAVRNFKQIIYRTHTMATEEGYALALAIEQNLVGMADSIEGPKAFSEKRKPNFQDK
ncbi:MAG: enoyl-CoA hydratase-related protein [Dehalococcoidales bacterium]|nr:enoyl-CoA hydratase-related protein [Dehalococcoidales bacterium]